MYTRKDTQAFGLKDLKPLQLAVGSMPKSQPSPTKFDFIWSQVQNPEIEHESLQPSCQPHKTDEIVSQSISHIQEWYEDEIKLINGK